jgi:hypothetical protein
MFQVEVAVCAPNSHILRVDVRIRCGEGGKFILAFVSKTFCNFCTLFWTPVLFGMECQKIE